jgi:hypothetical protein
MSFRDGVMNLTMRGLYPPNEGGRFYIDCAALLQRSFRHRSKKLHSKEKWHDKCKS